MNTFLKTIEPHLLTDDSTVRRSVMHALQEYPDIQVDKDAWDAKELIVEGLCHQFSPKALPIIATHMENSFNTGLVDLETEAYGTFTVLGAEDGGLYEWKRIAEEREHHFQSTIGNDSTGLVNRMPIVTEKNLDGMILAHVEVERNIRNAVESN